MPVRWIIYRIICIIQLLAASILAITSLINFFQVFTWGELLRTLLFVLIFLLSVLAINILNNNYPDEPVTGKQKTNFNRLFLVNFLFLVFQFGIIFAEYRELALLATFMNRGMIRLPFQLFLPLLTSLIMLVFQLIILYGLYTLRRELYMNFMKKQFEFEKNPSA
ncbi:MAG: hypothetical protein JNK14_02440 [Chitinophagaceae bacterium]|nr:hypothetical protein [Chitinophagaceae bacterium]